MNPAIAIPAYNRPAALERLLRSLATADIAPGTPLLISIDCAEKATADYPDFADLGAEDHAKNAKDAKSAKGSSSLRSWHTWRSLRAVSSLQSANTAKSAVSASLVVELAQSFQWPFGPKEVIVRPEHLGLVGNVYACGAAALTYGAVIVLEDDLIASARCHAYARQALAIYGDDPRLAGISLNSPWFNGLTRLPFTPLLDDGDTYFLQLSTPHGQVYTASQWAGYAHWLATAGPDTADDAVHPLLAALPADDWLGAKARYLADSGRFYAYPRESLTTAAGEPGTHFAQATTFFQVALQQGRRDFRLIPFDEAVAVYDGFYELLPDRLDRLTGRFHGLDYDLDLNATKPPPALGGEYVLTTRPVREAVATFGRDLRPLEANLIAGAPGRGIALARRAAVDMSAAAALAAWAANERDHARGRPGLRRRLAAALALRRYRL